VTETVHFSLEERPPRLNGVLFFDLLPEENGSAMEPQNGASNGLSFSDHVCRLERRIKPILLESHGDVMAKF